MNGNQPVMQDCMTVKVVDNGLKGINAFAAKAANKSYTFNLLSGGDDKFTEDIKASVKIGDQVDLIIERVAVAPFGRVWTSGPNAGLDVLDRNEQPIMFKSINIVSPLLDIDVEREAERQRARGIKNGTMFEWSDELESIATAAEIAAANDPIASIAQPPVVNQPVVNNNNHQNRH